MDAVFGNFPVGPHAEKDERVTRAWTFERQSAMRVVAVIHMPFVVGIQGAFAMDPVRMARDLRNDGGK